MNNVHITWSLQEGEQFVKKIGGVFAFKIKDGPGGKEATWVVDVKNGKGSVAINSGQCYYITAGNIWNECKDYQFILCQSSSDLEQNWG